MQTTRSGNTNGLRDGSLDRQLEFWKRRFENYVQSAEIPADHGHPSGPTARGARLVKTLSPEATARLKELSRREGVTIFMTLLAAFDIVLARHTGSEDVVVGSTISGRSRPEIEDLIGFFINALPLRMDLSGNPSFVDLLKRVREVCLDAYTHQDRAVRKNRRGDQSAARTQPQSVVSNYVQCGGCLRARAGSRWLRSDARSSSSIRKPNLT